jgi:hypothetical protein
MAGSESRVLIGQRVGVANGTSVASAQCGDLNRASSGWWEVPRYAGESAGLRDYVVLFQSRDRGARILWPRGGGFRRPYGTIVANGAVTRR